MSDPFDTSLFLDVASDGTYDVQGDAYDGDANVLTPSAGLVAQGVRPGRQLPAQHQNWKDKEIAALLTYLHDHGSRIASFLVTADLDWTPPARVTSMFLLGRGGCGGGGGGAHALDDGTLDSYPGGGGGGGGARYQLRELPVDGSELRILIGTGGAGGPEGTDGSDGGDTTVATVADPSTILARFKGAGGGMAGVLMDTASGYVLGGVPVAPRIWMGSTFPLLAFIDAATIVRTLDEHHGGPTNTSGGASNECSGGVAGALGADHVSGLRGGRGGGGGGASGPTPSGDSGGAGGAGADAHAGAPADPGGDGEDGINGGGGGGGGGGSTTGVPGESGPGGTGGAGVDGDVLLILVFETVDP